MRPNVSKRDADLRVALGAGLLLVALLNVVDPGGTVGLGIAAVAAGLAIVLWVTARTRVCPVYKVLHVATERSGP